MLTPDPKKTYYSARAAHNDRYLSLSSGNNVANQETLGENRAAAGIKGASTRTNTNMTTQLRNAVVVAR
jgi:hypothetical protein